MYNSECMCVRACARACVCVPTRVHARSAIGNLSIISPMVAMHEVHNQLGEILSSSLSFSNTHTHTPFSYGVEDNPHDLQSVCTTESEMRFVTKLPLLPSRPYERAVVFSLGTTSAHRHCHLSLQTFLWLHKRKRGIATRLKTQ